MREDTAPVDSIEKQKCDLIRLSSTLSPQFGWRVDSRHIVHGRGRAITARCCDPAAPSTSNAFTDARVAAPNTYGLRERMVESEQGPLLESEMHGPLLAQVDVAHGNRLVCTHARTHVKVRTCPVECTHIHAAAVE